MSPPESPSSRIIQVKAVHLTEARSALAAAYVAAGRNQPVYTDGSILRGVTPIRAVHIAELRAAVRALERITGRSSGNSER